MTNQILNIRNIYSALGFAFTLIVPSVASSEPLSMICSGMYSSIEENIDRESTGETSFTIDLQAGWVRGFFGEAPIKDYNGDDVIFMRSEGSADSPHERQTSGTINRVTGILTVVNLYLLPGGEIRWSKRYELRCKTARRLF
jgi:hypothetical protein